MSTATLQGAQSLHTAPQSSTRSRYRLYQQIPSPRRNMASDNVVPVKSVVIPPSVEQRVPVSDADAACSSINKAGFQ